MGDIDPTVFMIDQLLRFVGLQTLGAMIHGAVYAVLGGIAYYLANRAIIRNT